MIFKIILIGGALYHLLWTGNIILGYLMLLLVGEIEILDKLEKK